LVLNRELAKAWDLDRLMTTLAEELEVRERSSLSSSKGDSGKASSSGKGRHTLATLVAKGQPTSCPYCLLLSNAA
jgi:hypothetical protein